MGIVNTLIIYRSELTYTKILNRPILMSYTGVRHTLLYYGLLVEDIELPIVSVLIRYILKCYQHLSMRLIAKKKC